MSSPLSDLSAVRSMRDVLASLGADGAPPEVVARRCEAWVRDLSPADQVALHYTWRWWARGDQLEPPGDWSGWLVLSGRGWGKTRCLCEWVRSRVARGEQRVAFVGQTAADVRDVLIEGPSGILAISPKDERPLYSPTRRRLQWPNGCVGHTYSGDEPDQLRGPQHGSVAADELAKWRYASEAWYNMEMGLRMGSAPRWMATTTPRPIPLIRDLLKDPRVHVTRGATFDNETNLPPEYIARIRSRYEGTRIGRQELYGEVLEDVEGALFHSGMLDPYRLKSAPTLFRVVVGVDPQGRHTASTRSAEGEDRPVRETGIVVSGVAPHEDGTLHGYVLEDASGSYTPEQWGARVVDCYRRWQAGWVCAEGNYGGDMVLHMIRQHDATVPVHMVSATRGKVLRAEPIVGLYEQGRVHHVGAHPGLEDEMLTWVPDEPGMSSPNRLDALVWSLWAVLIADRPQFAALDPRRHAFRITGSV